MPGAARSESEKAFHLREMTRMYWKEGKTQQEIAEALGITQSMVSRDLTALQKKHAKQATKNLEAWQGDKIIELQLIKFEAWEAWEKSKAFKEVRREEVKDGKVTEVTTTENTGPDPRFLSLIDKAILTEHTILGLDKIDHETETTPTQVNITFAPVPARAKPIDEHA